MQYTFGELQDKANLIREELIKMLVNAGSGHSGGPLGTADFWTALYFGEVINYKADDPWWEDRDRVVICAGHYAPVIYVTLAEAGYFPKSELETLRKLETRLQGHPHHISRQWTVDSGQSIQDSDSGQFSVNSDQSRQNSGSRQSSEVRVQGGQLPGIETTSGPLGQGISQAVGMALVARLDKKRWRTVCFMSDGEQNEGQVWEAYMLASKNSLSNLTIVIDRNNIQIDGHTEDVMPIEPFRSKLEAFGLHVIEVDGHNIEEIVDGLNKARAIFDKPTAIVLHTIPGKGVEFMENLPEWHGKPPIKEGEAVQALADIHAIRTLGGRIISEHE